ncbi:MAG: bifunctional riboflavin kinase/FAD synthetase [Candidatus Neomarinimicrobiota bacterium]
MEIFNKLEDIKTRPSVVLAIGSFDGLHRGHRKILGIVRTKAEELGVKSMIITFAPTPREVLSGQKEVALMKPEEKTDAIEASGIDMLVLKHFDLEFAKMDPETFLNRLLTYLDLKVLVAGPDHSIGKKDEAGIKFLKKSAEAHDFELIVVDKTQYKGFDISSQLIRKTLKDGKIDDVSTMLGYNYRISGTVIPGQQRGRTMGFPTLNIDPDMRSCIIPGFGVYCVSVKLGKDRYNGICNIGIRPTFAEDELTMEVHVLEKDLEHQYNKHVEIRFKHFVREERKFDTMDALIEQINRDIKKCKILTEEKCQH